MWLLLFVEKMNLELSRGVVTNKFVQEMQKQRFD